MITFNRVRSSILKAKDHRRQLLGIHETDVLRASIAEAPHFRALLSEIQAEAERARREPAPELSFTDFHLFAAQGTRIEYEKPYFERRGRLLALALEAWLHPEQKDLDALQNEIWMLCNEYSWALPAHLPYTLEGVASSRVTMPEVVDLFASETAHALAETLYLLEGRLNPWVVHRVREEIERRIFRPMFDTPNTFPWESSTNNWSAVCGGAVGMAALLLVDDRERLAGMTDRVIRAMGSFLEGYEDDGCCAEGVGYWNYGFGYYVYFAEMLYEFTNGKLNLLQGDKIRRIASFPAAVALTAPLYVNFSDCSETYVPNTGLVSRLHRRLGQPVPEMTAVPSLHADHCYRFPHTVRNLLWTDASLLHQPAAEGTFTFPDTAWIIDKHRLAGGLFAFAAKGGHNDEPHNHNDLGHFILHAAGETLLSDLGAGVYTRDYFREGRYTYLHNASEGHSVPLINGLPQAADREHEAAVLKQEVAPDSRLVYSLDLTGAYPKNSGLRSYIRTFEWSGQAEREEAHLRVNDSFTFAEAVNGVEEFFISLQRPILSPGSVTWRGQTGEVKLTYDADTFSAEAEVIESLDHGSHPLTVHRLRLRAGRVPGEASWSFLFTARAL
ncbi:heparinase II/III family protein [Paenibacillus filicis]|uniref:Heparinase II/III family protein n=1 Tax=Paenibacillus gyeongsangnamensis TaxID=3388067 RepID=A0ABT4QFC9_9BACL|nr:heparinase II/III family protein [Paenibacillus filicis]MCZ8515567.1 heparinase II/III family protein [Paenibacillus filicis]